MGCGCGRKVTTNAAKQVTKTVTSSQIVRSVSTPVVGRRKIIKRPSR